MYLFQHPWYVCWLVLPYLVMDNRILWQLYPNITVGIQSSPSIGIEIDLKKLIVIRLMLQYLFESCLPRSSGPKRFLIILIRDFAVIASREFQLYLSLSYLFTFLYHTWIVICNTGLISKPVVSQPKCVWWIPSLPGFCRLKVCWNCFDQTPSQVNKNVQKRSVISTTPLGLQVTISWMFVNTSSNKSTFKVFYYKYWNQI